MWKRFIISGFFVILFTWSMVAFAHPGRTDQYGGHTESKTGLYHIHNADGTITYTEKPISKKTKSNSDTQTTKSQTDTVKASGATQSTQSVIVGQTEKPLQAEVQTEEAEQTAHKTTVYRYITNAKTQPFWVIAIGVLAGVGICVVSAVLYRLLKRVDGKNGLLDFVLYIPLLLILLPAGAGNLLLRFWTYLTADDKNENF